jgi:1-acyl-sn-glycerol-3-phosphate acyltransferase
LCTGLGFSVFAAGASIIALCVFPLLRWIPGDRERHAQRIVHATFRLWVGFATALGLFRVRWIGTERLRMPPPCIVVANHPTLIDIVLLISRMPQADCVVKSAAWRNPFLRWIVRPTGYIRNDGGGALVDACASTVRRGRWLVLFPEGTRSPERQLGPFRRGAAHVAVRSGAALLPVLITCDPPTLMKGQKWYHVPERMIQFTVEVGEPIAPPPDAIDREHVDARRLTEEIRALYEARLRHAHV